MTHKTNDFLIHKLKYLKNDFIVSGISQHTI